MAVCVCVCACVCVRVVLGNSGLPAVKRGPDE